MENGADDVRESTEPMAKLAQTLILVAGARYERRQLEPFGIVVRFDGTLAGVGIEDEGLTFDEVLVQFAHMVAQSQAFALAAFTPRANDECDVAMVIEHRDGACVMGSARLFRHADGMVDMTDETLVASPPQLFVARRH